VRLITRGNDFAGRFPFIALAAEETNVVPAMVRRSLVIGLSGVPGSGKTTLSSLLLRDFPGAKILAYDRLHPGMSEQQVEDWLRRGGDPNEMALDNLVTAVALCARPKPVSKRMGQCDPLPTPRGSGVFAQREA
jgi:hypothetical protein